MFKARGIARRTPDELALMRRAGRVVAEMHDVIRSELRPGVSTGHLDRLAREVLERRGARSNFLGYHGYPAVICASVNDVIVHGIPSDEVVLADGDLVSIDCGAIVEGWHGDAAFTAPVGSVPAEVLRLVEVADASLDAAIATMVDGARIGDIGHAVETLVQAAGFDVVREYTGHGIGRAMHEEPAVPNHGRPGTGLRLRPGNVLAVEPMVTQRSPETALLDDEWSVVTADGGWAAHVEHTIVVTDDGPEVLTRA